MFGIIEHLVNPVVTLSELAMQLKPNGYIVSMIIVNDSGIPYRYKPIEHLTYWTRKSIELLYEKCDLEMVAYKPLDMYETVNNFVDKLSRRLDKDIKDKVFLYSNLDDIIKVPTNNIITIGRKV